MKTAFPILYSRTSTNAVHTWQIVVDGDSYYTISGQLDGRKTQSEPSKCIGKNIGKKNETTPEEQAYLETYSKFDKQLKTGYTEDINNIDNCTSFIEPMLAKELDSYIDKIDFSKGVGVQLKLNGVRCIANWNGKKVILKSRKGEEWVSVPHIAKDLEAFFKKYPNAVLDGEIFNYDYRERLNDLIHVVRKVKNIKQEDIDLSEKIARYSIYDGYGFTNELTEDSDFQTRNKWIIENLPKYSKYYDEVYTHKTYSMKEVESLYEKFLSDKQEGAIIRILKSPYEHKRSKFLLKYKPQNSADAKIKAVHEGTGNYAGIAKTATIEWSGKTFDATFMGTQEQGREILKNKDEWENQIVEFLYTGLTGLGVPQYARIDPNNCFKGDR
jgi:ATP-dependent DNA ligase